MTAAPPPPPTRRPPSDTLERLYVLWIVSSLLLVLLVVILTLLGGAQLRRHAARISEQAQAIDELREALSRTRQELAELSATTRSATPPSAIPRAPSAESPEPARLAEAEPPEPRSAAPPADAAPDDRDINALLRNALRRGDDLPYELTDRPAAEELLRQALRAADRAAWSGRTWARLAVLAHLLDRDQQAEMFAFTAAEAGESPHAYYELSARKLLAQREVTEALVFARRLVDCRPSNPSAALLLAEAYRMQGNLAAAAEAIEKPREGEAPAEPIDLDNIKRLSVPARLRLGRLLIALERWDRLDTLLNSFGDVPRPRLPELNYLRAVLAIQRGKLPEALAILDNLLVEQPAGGAGDRPAQPDDYELRTWRGVALIYARQFQAAREALAHVQEHADRPEGWFWRGVLEIRAGNPDDAVPFFQRALAASERFAPAWEALGTIALNRNDLAAALDNLTNALNTDPRRGSAHFLLAIVRAKASRPSETLEALRAAFRLDPSLVEVAKQTEVLTRLFSDDELEALAGGAAAGRADTPPAPNDPKPD